MNTGNNIKKKEIRIRNLAPKRHEQIRNVAAYYGISMDSFLKSKITEMIESYPEHIKNRSIESI